MALINALDFKHMRLFVSVPVPDELKAGVAALGDELPRDSVSLVRPENMHLTLKFIGETDEKGLSEIKSRLGSVRFAPMRCTLRGVGVFPSESYVRVVWAGCESGGALESLAKEVMSALKGFGKDEHEKFSAHLTIARVKRKVEIGDFLNKHRNEDFGSFEADGFHLMQSVLKIAGPEYTVIETFRAQEKR